MRTVVKSLVAISLSLVAIIAAAAWAYKLRPYNRRQLENLEISKTETDVLLLQFGLPLESGYFPALVQYEQEGSQVYVTIYKQLAIGPFRGLWWTPAATDRLWQVVPQWDSVSRRVTAPVHSFGLESATFILRNSDGDLEIPTR